MQLLRFIEREGGDSYRQVLVIATLSGMANSLLLAIINHATEAVANGENLTQYFLLYMIAFALFLYGQWYAFERAILLIEDAIYTLRTRLTAKLRQVELDFVESEGGNKLYAGLTGNDTLISQSVPQMVGAFQMFSLMVFSFLYLGAISPLSFILTMSAMALGVLYFLAQSRFIKAALIQVRRQEAGYFDTISHLVRGFKETKINAAKGLDILARIAQASGSAQAIKAEVRKKESRQWGFGRLFIYVLLPVLVFILPGFSQEHSDNIFKISATLLFLIGPTTILVNMIPVLNRVNLAVGELTDLETRMDGAIAGVRARAEVDERFFSFRELSMESVGFTYPGANGAFHAGPFELRIPRGELVFIVGGNGSGKSTLLKLLTGLYYPHKGSLQVDGQDLDDPGYPSYRNLFSVIFTDFHLFDRFYGLTEVEPARVQAWLERMDLAHKVSFQDGGFTSTELSTGQRKRLALIAALLEDKPILVMDEFAADQDPQFRRFFYETLLGEIRAGGKTIIAVTHDDHYFHVADRVLKMDEGRLAAVQTKLLDH